MSSIKFGFVPLNGRSDGNVSITFSDKSSYELAMKFLKDNNIDL